MCACRETSPAEDGAGVPAPSRPNSDPFAPSSLASSAGHAAEDENAAIEGLDASGVMDVTEGSHVMAKMGVTGGTDLIDDIGVPKGKDVLMIDCQAQVQHDRPDDPRRPADRPKQRLPE